MLNTLSKPSQFSFLMIKRNMFLLLIILATLSNFVKHVQSLDPVYKISTFLGVDSPSNIEIQRPYGLFVFKDELFYGNGYQVQKVDLLQGVNISRVAGIEDSNINIGGNGGLATDATIGSPHGIAVNEKGEVYIVEQYYANAVRKVDTRGIIEPFAGKIYWSGPPPFSADGTLAVDAFLFTPYAIALNPLTGDVYISETTHNRVRVVYPNGTLSTIAGNGETSYGGDGGLATQTGIGGPIGIAFNPKNEILYIVVTQSRVLQVNISSGIISTLAGTGVEGFSGDGGLAVNAQLDSPYGICLGLGGEVYFSDYSLNIIRKISTSGIISTVAGQAGKSGFSGDGNLAINALLSSPSAISIDSNGAIYVADYGNVRVRKLDPYCLEGVLVNKTCDVSITCYGKLYNDSNVCNGHGKCVGIDNCQCNDGWKGDSTCSQFTCELLNECNGHGQCVSNNTCLCESGWKRLGNCSAISCDSLNECSGHGQCISNNTCACESGWKSHLNCSAISCELLNQCSGHGQCVSNNTCLCESGWDVNSQCSLFTCHLLNNCSGHGTCVGPNNCLCESGWIGNEKCSQFSCDSSNNCSNHGQCISNNTCICENGWLGDEKCSQFTCELLNQCSGHGQCVSNNTCQCESGWRENKECSLMTCDGVNECSGHGYCISNNTCRCYSNWVNSDCSIKECLLVLDENNQISCTNSNNFPIRELRSNSFDNLWIEFNEGSHQINAPFETSVNLDFSSRYFMISTIIPAREVFYSSIVNLYIQDSNSDHVPNVKVSKELRFYFNNLNIDQQLYNFTCLRFDANLGGWTNDSISTLITESSKQITCSTMHVTSVAIQRNLRSIPTNVIPKSSNIAVSSVVIGKKSVIVRESAERIVNSSKHNIPSMTLILIINLLMLSIFKLIP